MAAQQRMKGIVTTLLLCVSIIFMADSQAMAGQKCGELLSKRCRVCHSLSKTCAELGRDKWQWQRTIAAMANYAPSITAKEQKTLVECLVKPQKEVAEICRP